MDILRIGGVRWRASHVFWGSTGAGNALRMPGYFIGAQGRPTPAKVLDRTVDVSGVSALYALLHRAEPIYVGEAEKLGPRLKAHLNDDLAGLWDEFTWVSPDDYKIQPSDKGEIVPWNPATNITATSKEIVELMELVAINFSKQGLNSQKPRLALKWLQQGIDSRVGLSTSEKIDELYKWATGL